MVISRKVFTFVRSLKFGVSAIRGKEEENNGLNLIVSLLYVCWTDEVVGVVHKSELRGDKRALVTVPNHR